MLSLCTAGLKLATFFQSRGMKTLFMSLAGAFALTGLLTCERLTNPGQLSFFRRRKFSPVWLAYDMTPNKTVYLDLNTGETIDIG